MRVVEPSVELIWITPMAEQVMEESGRTCYKSECNIDADSAAKFVKRIIDSQHESVVEHASASFRIVCDRGISHELVRHRIASFSQESSRYCNYAKSKFGSEISVIRPPGMDPESELDWLKSCEEAEHRYIRMIGRGVKAEIARSVLPTCLKTEIVVTANLREWRHIIELRTSKAAHPQMREIANLIRNILVVRCPNVFGDFVTPAPVAADGVSNMLTISTAATTEGVSNV